MDKDKLNRKLAEWLASQFRWVICLAKNGEILCLAFCVAVEKLIGSKKK